MESAVHSFRDYVIFRGAESFNNISVSDCIEYTVVPKGNAEK